MGFDPWMLVEKGDSFGFDPWMPGKKRRSFGFDPCAINFDGSQLKFFKSILQLPRKKKKNLICVTPGFSIFFAIVVYWSNPKNPG